MKKTSELIGPELDWAVATCENKIISIWQCRIGVRIEVRNYSFEDSVPYSPSTDWAIGGLIVEREKIGTQFFGKYWEAKTRADELGFQIETNGPTLLIAAMRCYVASKLGNEVEIMENLL